MGLRIFVTATVTAIAFTGLSIEKGRSENDFRTVQDDKSGITMELPVDVLKSGQTTKWGRSWSTPDNSLKIGIIIVKKKNLENISEALRNKKGRLITVFERTGTQTILSGSDIDGSHFYTNLRQGDDAVRGFSIVYTSKWNRRITPIIERAKGSFASPSSATSLRVPGVSKVDSVRVGLDKDNSSVNIIPNIGNVNTGSKPFFSPSKRLVATFDSDKTVFNQNTIRIWETTSGRLLRKLENFSYFMAGSFFSDEIFASGHKDGTAKIWSVVTGEIIATFSIGDQWVRSVWLDATGRILVAGNDAGIVQTWDIAQHKLLQRFEFSKQYNANSKWIQAARLSEDGKRLILIGSNVVEILNVNTGKATFTYQLNGNLRFTGTEYINEQVLIVESGYESECKISTISLLRLEKAPRIEIVDKPENCTQPTGDDTYGDPRVYLSQDEKQLVVTRKGVPLGKVWNISQGRFERKISWPGDGEAHILSVSPDLSIALANINNTSSIKAFATGVVISKLAAYGHHTYSAFALANEDGGIALYHPADDTGSKAGTLQFWRGKEVASRSVRLPTGNRMRVQAIAAQDRIGLATDDNSEITLFSTEDGREIRRFALADLQANPSALLSPDARWIVAVAGGEQARGLHILDAINGSVRHGLSVDWPTSLAISEDSKTVAVGGPDGAITLWSLETGKSIRSLESTVAPEATDIVDELYFSENGQFIVGSMRFGGVHLWRVADGAHVRRFDFETYASYAIVSSLAISGDGRLIGAGLAERATSSGDDGGERGIKIWDIASGKLVFELAGHESGVVKVTFSSDSHWIISVGYDGTINYWDRLTGKRSATFSSTNDERWLIITDDGFFAGSPDCDDLINVVSGLSVYSVSQFYDTLYQPHLVRELLIGDLEGRHKDAASKLNLEKILASGPTPQLELIETKTEWAGNTVLLRVRVTDTGGGIGDKVVWRVDGITQGQLSLGSLVPEGTPLPSQTVIMTQSLRVDPSQRSVIEITSYNGAGLLASIPLRVNVDVFGATVKQPPRMHILAIGVDRYRMKDFELRYAVKDATAIAAALAVAGRGLFGNVETTVLTDEHVTEEAIARAFNDIGGKAAPSDVFILYLSGHGKSIEGRYYYYPQSLDFASGQTVELNGIGQEKWQLWLAKVPARKTLLILDTCESAAAVGLVRGDRMRETAMDQLQHATGYNLIAASRQAAFEGYKGHGVLSYALIEALAMKETPSEGDRIKVGKLADYVDERVPAITQSVFGIYQRPIRKLTGNDFPIGLRQALRKTEEALVGSSTLGEKGFVLLTEQRVRLRPADDALGERVLESATEVEVVEFSGQWALIALAGEKLGYVPAGAVKKLRR